MPAAGRAATLASIAGAVAWTGPALAPVVPVLSDALGLARRRPAGARAVHLTFDDGPHPQGTPAVLAALAEARARATFFLVGEQVQRHPSLAAEVVAAGHVVALHGHRHRCLLRLDPITLRDDLDRGADAIAAACGTVAPLYRAPYGIFSPAGIAVARRRGDTPWLWSRWGRDWRADATASSITARATRDLADGDVVLLHDADHYGDPGCWRATADALPRILDRVAAAGLTPTVL